MSTVCPYQRQGPDHNLFHIMKLASLLHATERASTTATSCLSKQRKDSHDQDHSSIVSVLPLRLLDRLGAVLADFLAQAVLYFLCILPPSI